MNISSEIKTKEPLLLDIIFECCGQQEAIDQAIDLLKPGGKLMLVGIPEVENITFKINELRRKEICIQNVRLKLLAGKKFDIKPWATHRFKLSQTQEAFELVGNYRDGVIKAMIDIK
jgi:L-iditol 2-dehydrogenase